MSQNLACTNKDILSSLCDWLYCELFQLNLFIKQNVTWNKTKTALKMKRIKIHIEDRPNGLAFHRKRDDRILLLKIKKIKFFKNRCHFCQTVMTSLFFLSANHWKARGQDGCTWREWRLFCPLLGRSTRPFRRNST